MSVGVPRLEDLPPWLLDSLVQRFLNVRVWPCLMELKGESHIKLFLQGPGSMPSTRPQLFMTPYFSYFTVDSTWVHCVPYGCLMPRPFYSETLQDRIVAFLMDQSSIYDQLVSTYAPRRIWIVDTLSEYCTKTTFKTSDDMVSYLTAVGAENVHLGDSRIESVSSLPDELKNFTGDILTFEENGTQRSIRRSRVAFIQE